MTVNEATVGRLAKITEGYLQWYRMNVARTPLFAAGDVVKIVSIEERGRVSVQLHNGVLNASGIPVALLTAYPEV